VLHASRPDIRILGVPLHAVGVRKLIDFGDDDGRIAAL